MTEPAAQAPSEGPSSSSPKVEPARADPTLGMKLTAKQQAAYDLTRPEKEGGQGKTYGEAAAILGISKPVVSKTLQAAYRKLGLRKGERGSEGKTAIELKNPEKAAAMMDAATDPKYDSLREAMRAAGFPEKAGESFIRRLRMKFAGPTTVARDLQTKELSELVGKKIHLLAEYLDDKVASEASARDLAMAMAQLIEKRQLLRGEPTQIISNDDRKKLHELMPALIAEGRRRGAITVDGQITEKTLEPQHPSA